MSVEVDPRGGRPRGWPGRGWGWQEWAAIAATLVIGVLVGPWVLRASQPLPLMSAGGRIVAIGSLEQALRYQQTGAQPRDAARTVIGMTFRDAEGQYCRTFVMEPGPAGLACREWGEWVIEVLARNPRVRHDDLGAFKQAGRSFPPMIRDAIDARISGPPLTREDEKAAMARNWRLPPKTS